MKLRISIFLLTLVAMLPLGVLYVISDFIGFVLHHVIGYRRRIVRQNLASSFPDKSLDEIKVIEKRYYRFVSDVMVETVKLLHISDAEMKRRVEVHDYEIVNREAEKGRPVVILLGHYGNWEWVQEMAIYFPDVCKGSIYHTMNSKLWDDIFLKIRGRWGNVLLPQKQAPKFLLNREHLPWIFGFIADQRPKGASKQGHTMFLNHDTAFITGPEEIGTRVNAAFVYLDIQRPKRGHYRLNFSLLEPINDGEPYPYTRRFWQKFEHTISRDAALWLWSHNRWNLKRK